LINEATEVTLKSGTKGSDSRSIGHYIKYVAPYLSSEGLKTSENNINDANLKNLSDSQKRKINSLVAGEKQGDSHETTGGRKVQISHIEIINGLMHGVTHTGERIRFSQLKKPKEFRTPNTTKRAFEIENELARNLGGVSAGPNRNALADVHAMVGNKEVKMESKYIGNSLPKFGQISIKHTVEKGWHFLGHDDLVEAAKKATVNGVPILDHLNKNNPDGKIGRNVRASTKNTGATRAYFKVNGANMLHLHGKNGGSTFTIGGDGKDHPFTNTGIRHLSGEHLDDLDGQLVLDGRGSAIFRPHGKNLRDLRDSARLYGTTRNLHDRGHAESWIKPVKSQ
jgi:hypothetical protein